MQSSDPLETVTTLASDFEMLNKVGELAVSDAEALFELLKLERPQDMPHRQFFHEVALPVVAHLLAVNADVEDAKSSIAKAASRFGNQTATIHGVDGLLVGKRDPALKAALELSRPMTKAERRLLRREGR